MTESVLFWADIASGLIAIAIGVLTVYWALSFGRVLANPIYRNRALWIGGYSFAAMLFVAESILYTTGLTSLRALYFLRPPGLFTLYAVLDSSIRTALDRDHFHRNTLRWRQIRLAFWILIPVLTILDGVIEYAYGFSIESYPPALATVAMIIAYSAITLVVSSSRTADPPMKRFVMWLGLAALTVVISIGVSNLTSNLTATSPYFPFVLGAYFLFRAARSLAPTSHLDSPISAGERGVQDPKVGRSQRV